MGPYCLISMMGYNVDQLYLTTYYYIIFKIFAYNTLLLLVKYLFEKEYYKIDVHKHFSLHMDWWNDGNYIQKCCIP